MSVKMSLGQLVELSGQSQPDGCPPEWADDYPKLETVSKDVSGEKGQIVMYSYESGHYLVATFNSSMVAVKEDALRALTTEDISDFDVVVGPASNARVLGAAVSSNIQAKGFSLCKLFLSPEDLSGMMETAAKCEEEGLFTRLPSELEPGYLGREGAGKTMTFDADAEDTDDFVRDSPLTKVEEAISAVGNIISPYVETELGFSIYSKTNTVLMLPFDGDEDNYVPPDCENEDAANFLQMMWRANLMILINAGPGVSKLNLIPKVAGDQGATVLVQPSTLVLFDNQRYKFEYKPADKSLTMIAWYLDQPKEYAINKLDGDFSFLAQPSIGPNTPKSESVSIVSCADRYAFGVDEPWKLWVGYAKAGFDTIIRHPFVRWDCDIYYEKDADQNSGKSYTCHGGFSDGIELFDCRFFDISPAEAKGMDPTQRQVLEVSYICLHGAGFSKKQLQTKPSNISMFLGCDKQEWSSIPKDIGGSFASLNALAIAANRFNYCMNLKGASMVIDTACSASLVCSHTSKLYLLNKHYDPVVASITTGVNLSLSPWTYIGGCGAGMHSHIGRCFTYNFSADGYTRGEATGSVCFKLKPWQKELEEMAQLAGSQVNQDGRSASLTAPNGPAQERCNLAVIKEAGITPPEIETTECHGTGTSLGDPIEIGAYRKVMAADPRFEPVCITSSKSNLGHCEGSAGVSGLMKCALLCMHGEGTPNQHLNCLNPHLDMDGFPGCITTENITYRFNASYNGVLSFGFGGTNACASCFGENICTSRGAGQNSVDVHDKLIRKLHSAPPQEVIMAGDDWEDWVMDGPSRDTKPDDQYDIDFDEDGRVTYTKREKGVKQLGEAYAITGTFNDWDFDPMDPDSLLEGLHTAIIEIGSSGQEIFQVVGDNDSKMTFYPAIENCTQKSADIMGPGEASRSQAWCIKGNEGDSFNVEFYRSESDKVSVTWVRN